MSKINYRAILLIPTSVNFSDINAGDSSVDGRESEEFDVGDNGNATDAMFSSVEADALLLNLLYKINDRQKIILMYQILREAGYNLNHADCAKTLSVTREHYMFLLKDVKKRAGKILQETKV